MVEDARKAPGPGPVRPLNLPAPVEVEEDGNGAPTAVVLRGRRLEVAAVEEVWEISDEWWRPAPVARRYYHVTTTDSGRLTLFRDLAAAGGGSWYCQRG